MIKNSLDKYAKSLERTFAHDRSKTIGASEIGQCARKMAALKHGGVEAEDLSANYGAHLRGTIMENHFWAPAMKADYGTNLLFAGDKQRTFVSGKLSATPDGVVMGAKNVIRLVGAKKAKGESILTECKTIDPRVDLKKEKSEHMFQVSVQIGLVREAKLKHRGVPIQPEMGVISYVDASFWNEVDEFIIPFDEKVFLAAKARADLIFKTKKWTDLPPEGYITGGAECEYCPFAKPCGVQRRGDFEAEQNAELDPQYVAEVTDACVAYSEIKKRAEAADEEKKAAAEKIKGLLRDKKVRKIPKIVNWILAKGRDNWDMPALRKAAEEKGVEVEKFCTAGEPSDQLRVLI
jgi:hypothetical protein